MNVHSNIIYNNYKGETTQYPSTDKWINKIWYGHTVENYLAIKRNEVWIHATTLKTLC